ncbi:myoneurin-like [Plodia interpunctella]|uniref:myoneurin-like n=1 Tax=Plodia interpunctella TaxID=58824 RepID=UPI002367DCEE|nr:myoneurin-like [Plodia interpunctella]
MCERNDDIRNCCRICLDVESEHVSILGDPTIHLHLKSCLAISISPNDELPKVICSNCVTQLNDFYNFQLNARCSQDWLESTIQEKTRKFSEKTQIQPLPDSEYNSDSLLEFLNNTANIEEYLNNLGKEDIPSIVNLLDRNEKAMEAKSKLNKLPTPKKEYYANIQQHMNMEIDVLDSEAEVVNEILLKETEPKTKLGKNRENLVCIACKVKCENVHKLTQHITVCDSASRTCIHCHVLFDSKQQMLRHSVTHNMPLTCNCGKQFENEDKLVQHCTVDYGSTIGVVYRCKQCGGLFKERLELYKHAKVHVAKAEERVCDVCGLSFRGHDALSKHSKEHEKTKDLMYRCKVCKYTSEDRNKIYVHVKGHTKATSTKHLCETCGRCFATSTTLLRHVAQHQTIDYKCYICHQNLRNSKALEEHMSDHNDVIMCDKCGHNFSSRNLVTHKCT